MPDPRFYTEGLWQPGNFAAKAFTGVPAAGMGALKANLAGGNPSDMAREARSRFWSGETPSTSEMYDAEDVGRAKSAGMPVEQYRQQNPYRMMAAPGGGMPIPIQRGSAGEALSMAGTDMARSSPDIVAGGQMVGGALNAGVRGIGAARSAMQSGGGMRDAFRAFGKALPPPPRQNPSDMARSASARFDPNMDTIGGPPRGAPANMPPPPPEAYGVRQPPKRAPDEYLFNVRPNRLDEPGEGIEGLQRYFGVRERPFDDGPRFHQAGTRQYPKEMNSWQKQIENDSYQNMLNRGVPEHEARSVLGSRGRMIYDPDSPIGWRSDPDYNPGGSKFGPEISHQPLESTVAPPHRR